MGARKTREERRPIAVRARIRTDAGWSDITIGNVSRRGMMLRTPAPLDSRTFVELRCRHVVVVGRVVWSCGTRCGVRTQDDVDIEALVGTPPRQPRKAGEERRYVSRSLPKAALPEQSVFAAARNRMVSRCIEFGCVATVCAAGCAVIAGVAYSALAAAARPVAAALAGT